MKTYVGNHQMIDILLVIGKVINTEFVFSRNYNQPMKLWVISSENNFNH